MSIFFLNDTATTNIYTLSLHDALPISSDPKGEYISLSNAKLWLRKDGDDEDDLITEALDDVIGQAETMRSEEHTSELQSRPHLVCRLLLEKKKKNQYHGE